MIFNQEFLKMMQEILGDEYDTFLHCMKETPFRGLRVNRLRIKDEELFRLLGFQPKKSNFAQNGYYLPYHYQLKNSLPYYAGLFYVQEPSASAAVTILDPKQNMKILDLCAAPGSKSTQIAEYLNHSGLLVTNEINHKRAIILAENLERHGIMNSYVLNADTSEIAEVFFNYFDMVLCDAPCSGEGMFRKDAQAMTHWSINYIKSCSERQHKILENAYTCLKPGGTLVYSTCTFNTIENEDTIADFLSKHSDMHMVDSQVNFGRRSLRSDMSFAVRIFPQDGGEGHFICKMVKDKYMCEQANPILLKSERIPNSVYQFIDSHLLQPLPYLFLKANRVYASNTNFMFCEKCRIIREGMLIGTLKGDRFEPEHAFFIIAGMQYKNKIELNDEQMNIFISGGTLNITYPKGYYAIYWHGYPCGFVKSDGIILKNKFPKAYRRK